MKNRWNLWKDEFDQVLDSPIVLTIVGLLFLNLFI